MTIARRPRRWIAGRCRFLLLILLTAVVHAQKPPEHAAGVSPLLTPVAALGDDRVREDSIRSSSSTLWWIGGGAGFGAATYILYRTDQSTSDAMFDLRKNNAFVRSVSPAVTDLGHPLFSAGLFGGIYLYGILGEDDRAKTAAVLGMESFVASGCAVLAIKELTGRERPYAATRPRGEFHGPFTYVRYDGKLVVTDYGSFPSAHTAAAFSAATVISDAYDDTFLRIVSYALATLVGVTRVIEGDHWFSDCFVGAAVGFAGAKLVECLNSYAPLSFTLLPLKGGFGTGLGVRF